MSLQDGQVFDSLEALQDAVQDYLRQSCEVIFAQDQGKPIWRCSGYLFRVCVADCIAVIFGDQLENQQWVLHTATMSAHGTAERTEDLYGCYAEDEDDAIGGEMAIEEMEAVPGFSQASCDSEATMDPSQHTAAQEFEEDRGYVHEEDEEEEPVRAFHGGRGRLSCLPTSSTRTSPNPRLSPTTSLLPFPHSSRTSDNRSSALLATLEKQADIECKATDRMANNADGITPGTNSSMIESIGVFDERAASMYASTAYRQSYQEAAALDEYRQDDNIITLDEIQSGYGDARTVQIRTKEVVPGISGGREDMPLTSDISSLEAAYAFETDLVRLDWAVKQDYPSSDTQGAVAPSSIFPSRTVRARHQAVEHGGKESLDHATERRDSISESVSSTPTLAMTSRTASVSSSGGETAQSGAITVKSAIELDFPRPPGSAPTDRQPTPYISSVSERDSAALLAALDGCEDSVSSLALASAASYASSGPLIVWQEQAALRDTELDTASEADSTSHLFMRYTWDSPARKVSIAASDEEAADRNADDIHGLGADFQRRHASSSVPAPVDSEVEGSQTHVSPRSQSNPLGSSTASHSSIADTIVGSLKSTGSLDTPLCQQDSSMESAPIEASRPGSKKSVADGKHEASVVDEYISAGDTAPANSHKNGNVDDSPTIRDSDRSSRDADSSDVLPYNAGNGGHPDLPDTERTSTEQSSRIPNPSEDERMDLDESLSDDGMSDCLSLLVAGEDAPLPTLSDSRSAFVPSASLGPSILSKASLTIGARNDLHRETPAESAADMYRQYMEQPAGHQAIDIPAETIHELEATALNHPGNFEYSKFDMSSKGKASVDSLRKVETPWVCDSSLPLSSFQNAETTHDRSLSQTDGNAALPDDSGNANLDPGSPSRSAPDASFGPVLGEVSVHENDSRFHASQQDVRTSVAEMSVEMDGLDIDNQECGGMATIGMDLDSINDHPPLLSSAGMPTTEPQVLTVRPADTLVKPYLFHQAILARQLDAKASDSDLSSLSDDDDSDDHAVEHRPEEVPKRSQIRNRKTAPAVGSSAVLAKVERASPQPDPHRRSRSIRSSSTQPRLSKPETTPRLPRMRSKGTAARSRKRKAASQRAGSSKAHCLMNASVGIENAIVGAGFEYTDDCRGQDRQYAGLDNDDEAKSESDDDCIVVVSRT